MAKLLYSALMSVDGFIEDDTGGFGWAAPSDEVHAFINDRMRTVGTHLYGRRLYETMTAWETDAELAASSNVTRDFADLWQASDKIVYSTTLEKVVTSRTLLERRFDADAVRALKATAERDLVVGGPELAAHAFRAGLVDECEFYLAPISVGGGKRALPAGEQVGLELLDQRRFANGMVYLHYRVDRPPPEPAAVDARRERSGSGP